MYKKYNKLVFNNFNPGLSINTEFIRGGFNYDNIALY